MSHRPNTANNCRTCGTTYPCDVAVRRELTMQYDDSNAFPFIEDNNCNITGYGHQDKAEFAAEVNRYDAVANGGVSPFTEDEMWTANDIGHGWAVMNPDGETLTAFDVDPSWPGAFPITTLWGQR